MELFTDHCLSRTFSIKKMKYRARMIIGGALLCMLTPSCVTQEEEDFSNLLYLEEQVVHKVPLADPYILVDNGVYYAYGTYAAHKGYQTYVSTDLFSWTLYPEYALIADNVIGIGAFWAPEVYKFGNKYYMYYSAEERTAVAESSFPYGPFVQSANKWNWLANCNSIDGNVLIESDKSYFYFVNHNDDGNHIYVVELIGDKTVVDHSTYTLCIKPSQAWETKGLRINEGPTVVKVGRKFLMTYSGGGGYGDPEYGVGVAVADDPMGPWEKYEGNPVMQYPVYKGAVLQGTGHNSLFKDLDGNWRMVFHAHSAKGIEGGRYMYIVSVDLLDHPPYIVFHDDLFAPVLAEEDATEGSTGTK